MHNYDAQQHRAGQIISPLTLQAITIAQMLSVGGVGVGWQSLGEYTTTVCNQPPRPTQPGHPSVGRRNKYWWFWTPLGKKQQILQKSRPCYQDCWHTIPAAEHHLPLAGTKLYCLVTDAHRCEQLVQGCYAAFAPSRIWTHDLLIASPMLYPLRHRATSGVA